MEVWSRIPGTEMPARRLVQTSRWEGMSLVQGRSSEDSEEGMDPRDAEDVGSTDFEREVESLVVHSSLVSLEIGWVQSGGAVP